MNSIIENIPELSCAPLNYVFENMNYQHKEGTLWMEFGVFKGTTVNYISRYTKT